MKNDLKLLLDQECFQSLTKGVPEYNEVTSGEIDERSIYCLLGEEELLKIEEAEKFKLNEGGADLEDISLLEKQARDYFNNPQSYEIKENREVFVTGFISIFSGINQDGAPFYKSTGDKITLHPNHAFELEKIKLSLSLAGYELSELIQVKFYGVSLNEFLGSRSYERGEVKELAPLSEEYSNILYAVPSSDEVDNEGDDSIFKELNRILNEEQQYGYIADEVLGKYGFQCWSTTMSFYETRQLEINEEIEFDKRMRARVLSNQSFKSKFESEIKLIEGLNKGQVSISSLLEKESHDLNRLLYVARNKSIRARIESKQKYNQIVAAARMQSIKERKPLGTSSLREAIALDLISRINSGDNVGVDALSSEIVRDIITLLWDRTQPEVRIRKEFVDIYFRLKKRYYAIMNNSSTDLAA